MQITQNSEPLIVFLLVDQETQTTPQTGIRPTVQLSVNGAAFANASSAVQEIGKGWYSIRMTAAETAATGPVIVSAKGQGTSEWRDIVQVVPVVEVAPPPTEPDDEGTPPPKPDKPVAGPNLVTNGDFARGSTGWNFYSNGKATWSVANGEARIQVDAPGNNIQLYQYDIEIAPGTHQLSFECKAQTPRNLEVYLHQHQRPYTNLGISDRVLAAKEWTRFEKTYQISFVESDARLRFWFARHADLDDVYWIRNVRLNRLG